MKSKQIYIPLIFLFAVVASLLLARFIGIGANPQENTKRLFQFNDPFLFHVDHEDLSGSKQGGRVMRAITKPKVDYVANSIVELSMDLQFQSLSEHAITAQVNMDPISIKLYIGNAAYAYSIDSNSRIYVINNQAGFNSFIKEWNNLQKEIRGGE